MADNFRFNYHPDQQGKHAYLSASKNSWTNYDDDKFDLTYRNFLKAARGTELHAYASEAIRLRRKQPRNRDTVNMFVNDVIGFRMASEQLLLYSEYVFGTTDAISFKNNLLRIFDLKTGEKKTSFRQLMVYAALFCLEYQIKPGEIRIELRIYQNNDFEVFEPELADIVHIMDKIIRFDHRIRQIRMEQL